MKIICRLSLLLLAVALVARKKDANEYGIITAGCSDAVTITDGWIESPQWLVDLIERSSNAPPGGEKRYPYWVHSVKHKGEEYILLSNPLSSSLAKYSIHYFNESELFDYLMNEKDVTLL